MIPKKRSLKIFAHAIKEVSILYWCILWLALICVINYECKIVTISGDDVWLSGLNKVAMEIMYAFITGAIIYFFVGSLPKARKKASVYLLVNNSTYWIYTSVKKIIMAICAPHFKAGQEYEIKRDEFMKYAHGISICKMYAKESGKPDTLFKDYVRSKCEKMRQAIDTASPYLELFNDRWTQSFKNPRLNS